MGCKIYKFIVLVIFYILNANSNTAVIIFSSEYSVWAPRQDLVIFAKK